MANIVIVSTTNSIKVDFGGYSSSLGMDKATYLKAHIVYVKKKISYVQVLVDHETEWSVNLTGVDAYIIDSIDGNTINDLDDLYTKIINLLT